ncbi:MAG: GHMP kinase [Bryobacterales bacterium]|nr:GHMP kinase [Bryobacterales bacterium]
MKLSAKSPCRVDLAGGTLDIWPLYLYHPDACTVNFAVDRYTHCTLETRRDKQIILRSRDLALEESFASLQALAASKKQKLPLLAWQLRYWAPATGISVDTNSEAPAGAGISGSSALMISIAHAFNRLAGSPHSTEKLREICQNIESQVIRVPTGSQDYYPAMYGGVSVMEMSPSGIRRIEIPVNHDEFNSRFVLAYTGVPRNSGINNWEVMKAHINGDKQVHKNFEQIAAIAMGMRRALEKQDWTEAARLLREEWSHRRKNCPTITTPLIDRLIEVTRKAGARGAKVCGAGGGGCAVFLVEPDAKQRVSSLIAAEGAEVLDVKIAPKGVRVKVAA